MQCANTVVSVFIPLLCTSHRHFGCDFNQTGNRNISVSKLSWSWRARSSLSHFIELDIRDFRILQALNPSFSSLLMIRITTTNFQLQQHSFPCHGKVGIKARARSGFACASLNLYPSLLSIDKRENSFPCSLSIKQTPALSHHPHHSLSARKISRNL